MTRTQRLRATISLLTGGYALALLIFLVLRLIFADSLWWLALLANFTPFYFAPFLVLLPLALILRAKRGVLLMLPLALIGAVWFGRLYLPKPAAQAPDDATMLKVVSFNVWDSNYDPIQAESWLRTTQADVTVIIELTPEWWDGVPALLNTYPEQFTVTRAPGSAWDSAILSRRPILSFEQIDLGDGDIPQFRAVIDVNGRQVAVYGIHLYVPASGRRTPFVVYDETGRNVQIRSLLARLERETLPYIVAGDFNMSDQSLVYNELAAAMTDSFREAGRGLGASWPNVQRLGLPSLIPPLVRIDYIWHSADFQTLDAALGPYLGSDHLPIYATLALG